MNVLLPMDDRPDDAITVGGISVPRLVERVGSTPFYAYDRKRVTARVAELRRSLPSCVKLHYAIKANPMVALVHHLAGLVDGFDVASANELKVALDTGVAVGDISFAGPGKTDWDIQRAVAAGVTISIESVGEIERIYKAGESAGLAPRVMIRVNPNFSVKNSGMTMAGGAKQFGIDEEQCASVFQSLRAAGMRASGIQVFWGSQNLDAHSVAAAQRETLSIAARLSQLAEVQWDVVNIGGGFGIPYTEGSPRLDIAAVGQALAESVDEYRPVLGDPDVVLELGRYLVAEAGVYVCRVVDVKTSRGERYAITDGGLHHHLAASGNFGQTIRKNFPIAVANKPMTDRKDEINVVGCLCTPIDLIGYKVKLPTVEVGDLLVVLQSGAYGATASPVNFISHPHPAEILV